MGAATRTPWGVAGGALTGTLLGETGGRVVSRWRSKQRAANAAADWRKTEEDSRQRRPRSRQ